MFSEVRNNLASGRKLTKWMCYPPLQRFQQVWTTRICKIEEYLLAVSKYIGEEKEFTIFIWRKHKNARFKDNQAERCFYVGKASIPDAWWLKINPEIWKSMKNAILTNSIIPKSPKISFWAHIFTPVRISPNSKKMELMLSSAYKVKRIMLCIVCLHTTSKF